MAACLQGLDSDRASNTANTDDWVEEDAARIFIVSVFFLLTFDSVLPHLASVLVFPTLSMLSSFCVFCNMTIRQNKN